MNEQVLKQNVGIDISKDDFYACLVFLTKDQDVLYKGCRKFSNTLKGFAVFLEWIGNRMLKNLTVSYTMESTGVYYEGLAYYLFERDLTVHVVLPNKAKKFIESLDNKSKTDKLDAKGLGRLGAERKLQPWLLSSPIFRTLKKLTREREILQKDKTRVKNQLHAEMHSADSYAKSITRMKNRIKYLEKQIAAIEKDIQEVIQKDELVARKVDQITTIPGIGYLTVATILGETNGFASIRSCKQLTSYAGYDIRIRESGKWKGKPKISKKGNSHLRRAMYMPSLCTIQYTETYKGFYAQLNERKNNGLISATAIQRKLLCLIYTLWKNDSVYIDQYQRSIQMAKAV